MDCAKRDVSYSGTWTIKNDELRLTKKEKVIVVGGELQKSNGSCASDFMIVGGSEKKMKVTTAVLSTSAHAGYRGIINSALS